MVGECVHPDHTLEFLSCGHSIGTGQPSANEVISTVASLPSAYEAISAASKHINTLHDIFLYVDKSPMTDEEKSKTKEILSIVDKKKDGKSLLQIKSLLNPLKTWLPVASPYINMLVTVFFK